MFERVDNRWAIASTVLPSITCSRALEQVMDGKTVLAIAHRLSTLSNMDRIIVLDRGKIVEQGSHPNLLKQNGIYSNFWKRQSGGFINFIDAAE